MTVMACACCAIQCQSHACRGSDQLFSMWSSKESISANSGMTLTMPANTKESEAFTMARADDIARWCDILQ